MPRSQHIALHPPDLFDYTSAEPEHRLSELMVIRGDSAIFTPPDPLLLFDLESLAAGSIPAMSHHPREELAGYAQGITPSTANGQRTIAILWNWVGEDKRARFMDPNQHSYGPDTAYERAVASRLRGFRAQGATIDSYLCHIRSWIPPDRLTSRQRYCTTM